MNTVSWNDAQQHAPPKSGRYLVYTEGTRLMPAAVGIAFFGKSSFDGVRRWFSLGVLYWADLPSAPTSLQQENTDG